MITIAILGWHLAMCFMDRFSTLCNHSWKKESQYFIAGETLRLRESKSLAQGHTAGCGRAGLQSPVCEFPKAHVLSATPGGARMFLLGLEMQSHLTPMLRHSHLSSLYPFSTLLLRRKIGDFGR